MPARPKRSRLTSSVIQPAYDLLFRRFGHQHWWPAKTPFEVCVGAILTQNTNWTNVRRAIANLEAAHLLDARRLYAVPEAQLAELIRPTGYFNVKARRLRSFLAVLVGEFDGDLTQLFAGPTDRVRARLMAIHGIGPETADSLLLYAGGHHSFVVDAYTRRIFQRHGWCGPRTDYHELQALLAEALDGPRDSERLDLWQDFHAQLVRVGNEFCRARVPNCDKCPLRSLLPKALKIKH